MVHTRLPRDDRLVVSVASGKRISPRTYAGLDPVVAVSAMIAMRRGAQSDAARSARLAKFQRGHAFKFTVRARRQRGEERKSTTAVTPTPTVRQHIDVSTPQRRVVAPTAPTLRAPPASPSSRLGKVWRWHTATASCAGKMCCHRRTLAT